MDYADQEDLLTFKVEKETMALCWQYIIKKNKKQKYNVLKPRVVQLKDVQSAPMNYICSHSFNKIWISILHDLQDS